jgi:hypothetical protein
MYDSLINCTAYWASQKATTSPRTMLSHHPAVVVATSVYSQQSQWWHPVSVAGAAVKAAPSILWSLILVARERGRPDF